MKEEGEIQAWWTEDIARLERELAAAIAERDTLSVAFDEYGQHLRRCINTKDNSCNCGFISVYYEIRRMKECGK